MKNLGVTALLSRLASGASGDQSEKLKKLIAQAQALGLE